MPKYKLSYFDIRGLAETTRILFAIGKVEYEDFRYPFSIEMKDGKPDFSTMKREEFAAAQAAGTLDPSMGKVPCLEVDGVVFGQSKSIERYVAKVCGLMGANDVEAGQIDAIGECVRDVRDATGKAEDKPAACGDNLKKLEKVVAAGGFAVGGKISYADVAIYMMLDKTGLLDGGAMEAAKASGCAKLQAIYDQVAGNAELKAWLAKRKDTPV